MIDIIKLPFKIQRLTTPVTNFVIIGDLIREAIAHEAVLKIFETCYIPVRSFGLEQYSSSSSKLAKCYKRIIA